MLQAIFALVVLAGPPGFAQEAAPEAAQPTDAVLADHEVTTEHELVIGGAVIPYRATAGSIVLRAEDGKPKATLFHVAYMRSDVDERAERPITFCFNGGPGSSSVWLHMGVFGPKRVQLEDDGSAPPPPYALIENEASILDVTDLVFIDPVMTGYSRPAEDVPREEFHGIDEDVRWIAEFIRLWTTRNERWESPKFLAGESYGTTRAAGLAGELQERHGMYLNGLVFVSSILNFQTARFEVGNDLPYPLFLPTYAATAWYHGRLEGELANDLRRTLDEVEAFAQTEYATALMKGDQLLPQEQRAIAERLARYTGLSVDYVERSNLRIDIQRFCKELLRDRRRTVGRLDSRFLGIDLDAAGESNEFDPSYAAIQGPFSAALNQYVRAELGFESDLPYEILTGRVQPWSYAAYANRFVNVGETLRSAMSRNQDLHVFVANGYYDLATPYFATEYTFDHLGLDASLRDHVSMTYYESGHMMYIHLPSLAKLKADLVEFYESTLNR